MTGRHAGLAAAVALLAHCALPGAGRAAERHVGPGQAYATIQAAIDAADPYDAILVHDGTYAENLVVDRPLLIRSIDWLLRGQNDSAVLDAAGSGDPRHGIEVLAAGVTIEGLSVCGALGMTADWTEYRAAVTLRAEGCEVAHNRLGWDDDHCNSLGLRLDDADGTVVRGNEVQGRAHGIWMNDSRDCVVAGNDIHGAVAETYSGGVYALGDYAASDPGGSSAHNLFADNFFHDNTCGIHLLSTVWWNTFERNEISGNYIGVYVSGGCSHNTFSANTVRNNANRGFHIRGSGYNTLAGNRIDNNHNGIWFGFLSPSDNGAYSHLVVANEIVNNAYAGIRISARSTDNRMVLNTLAGNLHNVISEGTEWSTSAPVSYYHLGNHRSPLGNWYDTYTGLDLDGDGIGDTDLPFTDGDPDLGPEEYFPLVAPPAGYSIQAWYGDAGATPVMHRGDVCAASGELELPAGGAVVWRSDEPARDVLTFAAGAWSGQITFAGLPGADVVLAEVGSTSGGADFSPSGAAALVGSDWAEPFETTAAAVTVPAGHYLALRLSTPPEYPCAVRTGAMNLYLSSPGLDDPLWPGGWVGDVPAAAAGGARLAQNRPNPFNPRTVIVFELDAVTTVDLAVYDLAGRLVRTLASGRRLPAGGHELVFDGRDDRGRPLAAGVYAYRLRSGGTVLTRRMALVR